MDIANVDFALNMVSSYGAGSSSPVGDFSVAVLDNVMELNETLNTQMVQALEHSVTPNLGGNIDVYV